MRKLSGRETGLVIGLALAAAAGAATLLRKPEVAPTPRPRPKAEAPLPAVPRIDLARLDQPRAPDQAGRRDLFGFGARAEPDAAAAPPPRVPAPTPPPAAAAGGGPDATADARPATPVLPPLNLRYIGSVESARGVKVAVLVTDKREVLTGQAGEVVANRYRIARIGLESVDLEDVGTGQSRRIPLRGGS